MFKCLLKVIPRSSWIIKTIYICPNILDILNSSWFSQSCQKWFISNKSMCLRTKNKRKKYQTMCIMYLLIGLIWDPPFNFSHKTIWIRFVCVHESDKGWHFKTIRSTYTNINISEFDMSLVNQNCKISWRKVCRKIKWNHYKDTFLYITCHFLFVHQTFLTAAEPF